MTLSFNKTPYTNHNPLHTMPAIMSCFGKLALDFSAIAVFKVVNGEAYIAIQIPMQTFPIHWTFNSVLFKKLNGVNKTIQPAIAIPNSFITCPFKFPQLL